MTHRKTMQDQIKNKTFLITGGAGFIGCNLAEALLKNGAAKVRVLDNLSTGLQQNIDRLEAYENFEFIKGDIRDYDTCKAALDGIEYVSHQAALGSVPRSIKDPITSNNCNITGHLNMLTAAKDCGHIKRFVYAASSSTYGDSTELPKVEGSEGNPLSPYAITKLVNELYANIFSDIYGFHTIGLRYFNVFGPHQSPDNPYAAVIPLFMQAAVNEEPCIINGDGLTSRDFTYIENAVQANIKAMLNTPGLQSHQVMNIAYGERTTLTELWQYITHAIGVEIPPKYGPERPGDIKHSLADISKARTVIGYDPKVSVRAGLIKTLEWFEMKDESGKMKDERGKSRGER